MTNFDRHEGQLDCEEGTYTVIPQWCAPLLCAETVYYSDANTYPLVSVISQLSIPSLRRREQLLDKVNERAEDLAILDKKSRRYKREVAKGQVFFLKESWLPS